MKQKERKKRENKKKRGKNEDQVYLNASCSVGRNGDLLSTDTTLS